MSDSPQGQAPGDRLRPGAWLPGCVQPALLLPCCRCSPFNKQFTPHLLQEAVLDHTRPPCLLSLLHLTVGSSLFVSLGRLVIPSLSCLLNSSGVDIYSSQENYKQGVWHKLYYSCSPPLPAPPSPNKTQLRV